MNNKEHMMSELKLVRELLLIAILAATLAVITGTALMPERYGEWLQRIDNGRFNCEQCDTEWD
jgi:H+/Cl- antiporter ClcA